MRVLASPPRYVFFLNIIVVLLIASCKSNLNSDRTVHREADGERRYTDFLGAAKYEFNRLKDPATGKIPEGIHEQELAQARDILKKQLSEGRVAANTYTVQGPNNLGGRTRSIAYDVRYDGGSNRIILAGGVSGGVYKSIDDGATWVRKSPTGEHFSCTGIAQDHRPGFQDTWYYTTGEGMGNSASVTGAFYSGNGVYKSIDNGETWARLASSNATPLESFTVPQDIISKVIVNPTNGDIYIACAAAIRRSQDGGTSWASVLSGTLLSVDQYTDIVVNQYGTLYASFGGDNSSTVDGVWTSTSGNSGAWTRIAGAGAGGSPVGWKVEGSYGRVVLALGTVNDDSLYALYWNGITSSCGSPSVEAALFRFDSSAATWTDLSAHLPDEPGCLEGNDPFAVQTGYDMVITIKPDDGSVIYIGGTNVYRSTDAFATSNNTTRIGGYADAASYALYPNSHPDIHAIEFQPGNPAIMLCGNDGGIQRTTNDLAPSVNWSQVDIGYRTYQYYYVTLDPRSGNEKVMGGAQDNGTTRNIGGTGIDFEQIFSGDGVSVGLSNVISSNSYEYCGSQSGDIERRNYTDGPDAGTSIRPLTASNDGLFVTLFDLDPDNTEKIYYANDSSLYRNNSASTATTTNWTLLSGIGLTVGKPNTITALATTRGVYSAITASLFIGTDNAKVYRLDDPGGAAAATAPVNISTGLPGAGNISSISVNPRNDDTVLVTLSNYGVIDIWWTGNANSATPTWTNVERNLTLPSVQSSAIAISAAGVEYFVGTSIGLYRTTDPLAVNWTQEGPGDVGNAVVTSLALRVSDNKLLVGTHGYGMWQTTLSTISLPITLIDFKGKLQKNNVLLEWITSSEFNSSGFELERSYDGMNFYKIGFVRGAGNSNTTRSYQYLDREPATVKNYYRLKMIDIDGRNKRSNVVLVRKANESQEIYVTNPFSTYIEIRFVRIPAGKIKLTLVDLSGKQISAAEYANAAQPVIRFSNSGKSLSNGVYVLRVETEGNVFTKKIVKQ